MRGFPLAWFACTDLSAAQPPQSLSETSFYKHIDPDLPAVDRERIRQPDAEDEAREHVSYAHEYEVYAPKRLPQPHKLPPEFQDDAEFASSISLLSTRQNANPTPVPPIRLPRRPSSKAIQAFTPSTGIRIENELLAALATLQFKLDILHSHLDAAQVTLGVCERLLDEQYRGLIGELDAMNGSTVAPGADPATHPGLGRLDGGSILARDIARPTPRSSPALSQTFGSSSSLSLPTPTVAGPSRAKCLPLAPSPLPSTSPLPSPHTLVKALTRVDPARPPAQVSVAARRAVQGQVGKQEKGSGGLGVPSPPMRARTMSKKKAPWR